MIARLRIGHRFYMDAALFMALGAGALSGYEVLAQVSPGELHEKQTVSYESLLGIYDLGMPLDSDLGSIAISPDGRLAAVEQRQAILPENKIEIRWLVVPLDGRNPAIDAGDGGEPVLAIHNGLNTGYSIPQIPRWTRDSNSILYLAKYQGFTQLWRSQWNGERREQLTKRTSDIVAFTVSPDDRTLLYLEGPTQAQVCASMEEESLRGFHYDDRFSPLFSREPIVDVASITKSQGRLWAHDLSDLRERLATESEKQLFARLTQRSPESSLHGKGLRTSSRGDLQVWLQSTRAEGVGINQPSTIVVSKDEKSKLKKICEAASCTGRFEGLWIDEEAHTVYFLRWAGRYPYGPMALYGWNMESAAPRKILMTKDYLSGCARAGSALICGRESPVEPASLVKISLKSGAMTQLYDPNAKFKKLNFGAVSEMVWKDGDGAEGFGHLIKPIGYQAGRRYPLVIVQYRSRGFLRGGVGDEVPIQVLASKGFAVLSFHRPDDWDAQATSNTYEKVQAKGRRNFADRRRVLSVLLAGIDVLDRQGIIDRNRVGISGLSDGAETAVFALIHAADRFAAASISNSWRNPILFYLSGPKLQPVLMNAGMVDPNNDSSRSWWQTVSLALNAQTIGAPILIHASDSELLPETQAFSALRQAHKPVEMYVFAQEGHIKAQPRHRLNIYKRNVQWFEFWLQGVEEENAIDPDQYRRWRALRSEQDEFRIRQ